MGDNTKFCVYCGKALYNGEMCSCADAQPATEPTGFCVYCGKALYNNETCNCTTTEPVFEETIETVTEAVENDAEVSDSVETVSESVAEPTGFCVYCGKALYNNETCECTNTETGVDETVEVVDTVESTGDVSEIVEAVSESVAEPTGFCVFCGKSLYNNETCSCTGAETVAEAVSEPTGFCVFCGKALYNNENCSCVSVEPVNETVSEPIPESISEPVTEPLAETAGFCVYCGKELRSGEICNCGLNSSEEKYHDAVADTYAETEETHFCVQCGKVLHGSEVCSCELSAEYTGSYDPAEKAAISEVYPKSSDAVGGLKSTMRTGSKPKSDEELLLQEEGKQFLLQAGDLELE